MPFNPQRPLSLSDQMVIAKTAVGIVTALFLIAFGIVSFFFPALWR